MGNLLQISHPEDDQIADDEDEMSGIQDLRPLKSLQHKKAPAMSFSDCPTPLTLLLEMQPDLLRFVFTFFRSEEIFKMRILNHYLYWLISKHVNLYFMNQVIMPKMLELLTCTRIKSLKVVSAQNARDLERSRKWFQNHGKQITELELVGFQFTCESAHVPDRLKNLGHILSCLPELRYLAIHDKNCGYNEALLDSIKSYPVKHLSLKCRKASTWSSPTLSLIQPSIMNLLTELTLQELCLNQSTLDNLTSWISRTDTNVEGFHLLFPYFSTQVDTTALFEQALAKKLTLKRLSVSFDRLTHNMIESSNGPSELLSNNFFSPKSRIEELRIEAMSERHSPRNIFVHLDRMKSLKSLDWRGPIGDENCVPLSKESKLKRLTIQNAFSTPPNLFSDVVCADCNLSAIRLRETAVRLSSNDLALFENQSLRSLTMRGMYMDVTPHLKVITAAKFTPNIQILDLSQNEMDPRCLSAVIRKCEFLTTLNISRSFEKHPNWTEHIGTLISAIGEHKSLRDVDMSANVMTNAAFSDLWQMLRNPHLENLNLNLVTFIDVTTESFVDALQHWLRALQEHQNMLSLSLHGFGGCLQYSQLYEIMVTFFNSEGATLRCNVSVG